MEPETPTTMRRVPVQAGAAHVAVMIESELNVV